MAKKGLRLSPDDTLLAGFSSGALNIAAINACFGSPGGLSWDHGYKEELFQLTTEQVYRIHWNKPLPVDTGPLRERIDRFLDRVQLRKMGDLSFISFILLFSLDQKETYWASSTTESRKYLMLSDLLLASSAIPLIFPARELRCESGHPNDFPGGLYSDGGTMGIFKGFADYLGQYVMKYGAFDTMYIISPMWGLIMKEIDEVFKYLEKNIGKMIHADALQDFMNRYSLVGFNSFLSGLHAWGVSHQPMAQNILICSPELPKNFPLLNFNQQKPQYDAVCEWSDANPQKLAIPLEEYLSRPHSF